MYKAAALCVFGLMICSVQGMSLQNNKYNSSYTLCKDLDDPGNLVANVSSTSQEDVNAIVRIPERSVFANSISCIKVIDNMENQDISEAAVNYGGLGKSMVEFKIYFLNTGYTGIDSGYDYTFLIYTKPLSTKLQSHRKHLA